MPGIFRRATWLPRELRAREHRVSPVDNAVLRRRDNAVRRRRPRAQLHHKALKRTTPPECEDGVSPEKNHATQRIYGRAGAPMIEDSSLRRSGAWFFTEQNQGGSMI